MLTKHFLDDCYSQFDKSEFLSVDPLGIVYELKSHASCQLDIELGSLFVAMLSWGNRKQIRKTALSLLRDEMQWHPAEYLKNQKYACHCDDTTCLYRTLKWQDFSAICLLIRLCLMQRFITTNFPGVTLEDYFRDKPIDAIIEHVGHWLRPARCGTPHKSACKRICMWLRWMIRPASPDLGLWRSYSPSTLYAVMDTHVMQLTAPLLYHKGASWTTMQELTNIFRLWDPADPLKYDLALMRYADLQPLSPHREASISSPVPST